MQKLYETFHIFPFQKRIASVETIWGNTVFRARTSVTYMYFEKIQPAPVWVCKTANAHEP